MNTNEEKISVLIPVYNNEKYIKKCIMSVLNQTYQNIEVIIVDDGSKDNSYSICQVFERLDPRIKLFKKENEKSIAKTRNFLLSKITAPYFTFVDSDDYVKEDYIELLYQNLKKYDSDLSSCDFSFKYSFFHTFKLASQREKLYNSLLGYEEMVLGKNIHFMLWNKLFKTELIKDITFDNTSTYGEDFIFCYQYIKKCKTISYINKKLYYYVVHKGSSVQSKFDSKKIQFLFNLVELYNKEENKNYKSILSCWIAFSSAGFLFLARKDNYENKEHIEFLKKQIHLHKEEISHNKNARLIYRFIVKTMSKFA